MGREAVAQSENPHQAVGEADGVASIRLPQCGMACKQCGAAAIGRMLLQQARQLRYVAQGEIEALAGHRVQGLSGISQPDGAFGHR